MLIELFIEFQLRGPGPRSRTCALQLVIFMTKQKSLKKISVDHYLLLKYCTRQCALLPPTLAKLLTKFNPKMQNFNRV